MHDNIQNLRQCYTITVRLCAMPFYTHTKSALTQGYINLLFRNLSCLSFLLSFLETVVFLDFATSLVVSLSLKRPLVGKMDGKDDWKKEIKRLINKYVT